MNIRRYGWASLLLIGFAGPAIKYVNVLFTTSLRWAILGLVFLVVVRQPVLKSLMLNRFMFSSLAFAVWAMATSFWSEVPALSLMKSSALLLVIVAGAGAGYLSVRRQPLDGALNALAPLTFLMLVTGLLGPSGFRDPQAPEMLTLYQGLTGNANMFGVLCAMAIPYPVWRYFSGHFDPYRKWWGIFVLVLFGLVMLSNSRAAIATTLFVLLGAYGMRSLGRSVTTLIVILLGIGSLMWFFPATYSDLELRYFYKGERTGGVLISREDVWDISYSQALKGGIIGGGYGVTIGDPAPVEINLSSAGYGREKGNSQLGIVEETGLIGIALYAASLVYLFATLWRAYRYCPSEKIKVMLGIVIGGMAGFTFQSVFEAWFNAPGSPECMYYWVLAGIAIGLATDRRLWLPPGFSGQTGSHGPRPFAPKGFFFHPAGRDKLL